MGKKCLFRQVHTVKTEPFPAMGGDPPSSAMAWLAPLRPWQSRAGLRSLLEMIRLCVDSQPDKAPLAHGPARTKSSALMLPPMGAGGIGVAKRRLEASAEFASNTQNETHTHPLDDNHTNFQSAYN